MLQSVQQADLGSVCMDDVKLVLSEIVVKLPKRDKISKWRERTANVDGYEFDALLLQNMAVWAWCAHGVNVVTGVFRARI